MKFIAAATLAFAATVAAVPTTPHHTTPDHSTPDHSTPNNNNKVCSQNTKQVCCTGFLTCLVQAVGGSCNNDVYCCNTGAPEVR